MNVEETLANLEVKFTQFATFRSLLSPGQGIEAPLFSDLLGRLEEIHRQARLLGGYASLAFAQDTSDQKAQSLLAKIEGALARIDNEIMFFSLWWKGLPEDQAGPLLGSAPDYGYMLTRERAFREHTLTEPEEKIINIKDLTGREALNRLYETITNGYAFIPDFLPPDQRVPLTRDGLAVHFRSHLPERREGAYKVFNSVYGQAGPILGQIYQGLVQDWHYGEVVLRRHPTAQSARNKHNDLGDETVASLLRVCRAKAPEVFGRYFKLKAKRLGLPALRRYDIYAPLKEDAKTYPFDEALREVELAFRAFDDEFADLAMKIPQAHRLHAAKYPGKQGGAFCASHVPGEVPWVLMNYGGHRHDLFTLAHELGHAVHSLLAADHNIFEFHSALPMAETASTFGEMLLAKRFREVGDPEDAEALAFSLLDDAYATVGRQAFFALFEVEAHRLVQEGATPDELAEVYLKNLSEGFGDAVDLDGSFRWEWVSVPHFYQAPFYVYAYSFGLLLVYGLWNLYQAEGQAFVPKMKSILAKGGSDSPEAILAAAGLGPLNDDFWLGGFAAIESLIPKV
jgi:oligoendopeptidase F